jgi:LysR family glycine cleavage system transcriptional activator
MARKLPPLHLLNIFEVSARLESFKLASEELFITPSAISHQIKSLEKFVGFDLFHRKSRGVALNPAGKVYLHYIQQSLTLLEKGTNIVINKFSSPALKISTFPTMASNVIIPQLSHFQNKHPDIDIRIETGMKLADLRYDDFDIAIRVGSGDWPGVVATKLLDLKVAAVCSPSLVEKYKISSLSQLNTLPLIALSDMDNAWQEWGEALNITNINLDHKLTFSHYDAALQAAQQGLGLALALTPIENPLFGRNLLVNPFGQEAPYSRSVYAVYRAEDKDRHDIQCFINWLIKSPNLQ